MTQVEAVQAYKILTTLASEKLPVNVAYLLFKQKRALQAAYDFQVEQETAIANRYHATVDANGFYHAKDETDMPKMAAEIKELADAECTIPVERVDITVPEDFRISVADMEKLDPVINFVV